MTLGPLSDADARDLLTLRLGVDRVIEQPDAVGRLIDRCAGLPLALTVTASRAASFDTVSMRVLADELDAASSALDMFETGDGPTGVRTVLTWSYRHLSPEAAELFRLLSVHPGPDISLAATAALADVTESVARTTILELCTLSLAAEHVPGRYRLHSLLRTFASEVAAAPTATPTNATAEVSDPATDQRAALRRVVDYYLRTSIRAAHFLSLAAPPTAAVGAMSGAMSGTGSGTGSDSGSGTGSDTASSTVPGISSVMEALAWFATEQEVLTAILGEADRAGFDSLTWRLATAWSSYLNRRGMWAEDVACCRTGLAAARRSAESEGQATLHRQLGRAFARRRDSAKSIQHLRRALDLYRTSGNRLGQAEAWRTIAALHALDGSHAEAVDAARQASEIYRTADHREGHAAALNEIGWSLCHLGRLDQALALCRRAIETLRSCEPGGRRSTIEASVRDSLGGIHHRLGQHAEAVSCYAASIRLFDELAEPYQNALARMRLGDVHADAGDFELARTSWAEALAILDRLGNPMRDQVRARLGGDAADAVDGASAGGSGPVHKHRTVRTTPGR
jgi:tetratricopeptide (TPR) repeat protein